MSEEERGEGRFSAPITGFVDYTPQQQYCFNEWLKRVAGVYEGHGFTPLHLRPFEPLRALEGEGETQKQIFEVFRADTGKTTHLGLPFDHTVPLALWVAEHAGHLLHLPFPYKRYDMGLSYRGERPKLGRFRAFVQADVDIVGRKLDPSADKECLLALIAALEALSVGPIRVRLNHLFIVKSLLSQRGIPQEHHAALLRSVDKLDKLSKEEVAAEIARIEGLALSTSSVLSLLETFSLEASLDDLKRFGEEAAPALESIRHLIALLTDAGVPRETFCFSPGMVRGLAYYTGTVFEILLVGKEQYGSVAGGGRYSNLVGSFSRSLQDVEGVGGTLGLTRLFDILCKTGFALPQRTSCAHVLVGARVPELMPKASKLASALRAKGWKVDLYSGAPKIKNLLAHANAIGVPLAALVMDESAFVIKKMDLQVQNEFATLQEAVAFLGEPDAISN